ncbi:Abhydrolase domain-containing protein 4 [Folsomia candida]|uniref:Abhydrolase domain-containing protein 4 n=1 Tax=Folsomia candida TaxID=158441 RepID=A0A226EWE4_FOLCA|nr:Abhydrolase domain-containing protein 4 [Folsomia candida]
MLSLRLIRLHRKQIPRNCIGILTQTTIDIEILFPIRRSYFRWIPTSDKEFAESERKLLTCLKSPYETCFVDAGEVSEFQNLTKLTNIKIQTLAVNKLRQGTPLVLLHGMGLGLGSLLSMINAVSSQYQGPIYALDLPGFGRSTRLNFPTDPKQAEETYIKLLEGWRRALHLTRVSIVGYSLGGFLATSYALKYSDRLLGPLGPLVHRGKKESKLFCRNFEIHARVSGSGKNLSEYLYHCMAANPRQVNFGEAAFRSLMDSIVFAKNPMCQRLYDLRVPMTMVYPQYDWFIPGIPSKELQQLAGRKCPLRIHTIPSTNHETILFAKEVEQLLCDMNAKTEDCSS